jgi:hypothetical protein
VIYDFPAQQDFRFKITILNDIIFKPNGLTAHSRGCSPLKKEQNKFSPEGVKEINY